MRIKNVLRMVIVAVLTAVLLLACDSDDDAGGGGFPVPLPINCVVPGECLSVTASWCVPDNNGNVNCSTNNVDVSLDLPGGGTVGVGTGELLDLAGCIHDGDDQAGPPLDRDGDGQLGPFSENITCSPFVQPVGPPAIAPGLYVVSVRDNFSVLDTGMIVDDGSVAQINVNYP